MTTATGLDLPDVLDAGWTSVTSADLLVSLRAPAGWDAVAVDATSFELRGGAEGDPVRPVLSFEVGYPEEPGHDWFDWFTVAVIEPLSVEVPGFELVGSDRFRLSSLPADVFLLHLRRTPSDAPGELPPTSQTLGWIWVSDERMYVVGGSTLREREELDLPVFEAVLRSTRLLRPLPVRPLTEGEGGAA